MPCTVVNSWQDTFGHPTGALLGFMTASYPLGAILSSPFSAPISDFFGRRWTILIGSIIMVAGTIMQAAASTVGVFIGARIIIGFGITLALTTGPILISELAHPRHRVVFTALYNSSWYLGALTVAWITYASVNINSTWAWRLPTTIQAAPAILQIIFIFLLPESPRWLIFKDRNEEALSILVKYHGDGNPQDALVQAEFREISETLRIEKSDKTGGIKLFVSSPGNRRRFAILVVLAVAGQWSGNGLVSYYLSKILSSIGIKNQRTQTLINGLLTTTNWVTSVFAAVATGKIARRKMFMAGGIGMFFSYSALTISVAVFNETANPAAGRSALGFIFIYYTFYNVCLNPLFYLYPAEILPYRMRASGMSILVAVNKLALFFNQLVNPVGLDSIGWKYYLVFVVYIAFETGVFWWLFPETLGYSLEGIGQIFDKMDAEAVQKAHGGLPGEDDNKNDVQIIEKS
jgi:sugar porter (SP) family MFS transporter